MKQDYYDINNNVKEHSFIKELISWVLYIAIAIVLSFFIISFVGQRTVVDGSSMNPTLQDKDNLIVDKISYRFNNPERFDIIVFPYKENTSKHFIKRIIGLPGETVQIIDGTIYINGDILQENYGLESMNYSGIAQYPITLGNDEYFVLGDNRNNSKDSRFSDVGNINKKDITGRAFVRLFPNFTKLKHK